MKVLIIENEPATIEFMLTAFEVDWPEVKVVIANDGTRGLELVETETPDIVLLDLGLPDMSGFDVLKNIRLFSTVPVIVVTVSGEEKYVVRGLAMGADDYLAKPLRPLELMARMKKIIRKRGFEENLNTVCGELHFGSSLHELFNGNTLINLTNIEGRMMYTLMEKVGKVVTYSQLADAACGGYYPGVENSLKSHIRHLRQKIEDDASHPRFILNSSGIGYMLVKPKYQPVNFDNTSTAHIPSFITEKH